ncbi:similar to Saccharomyces cerevisiae YPR151C SUE1 Mitochondrial protein required for degradation of unstable forms of cytochrome c [Maudiozyma saulgeensis]|uniref:Similar to Saccharomyces cerevisiae YPR151C SUE1 Mitochondrial protein required for degradation of unstable forms of cytochrome c n=1 Tax=Maudiozyma saulgeensis TaxID=1789683 RepID=A0A1X7QWT8_9SACH|nr:similar to Saccharomyces cerevisiae YPR151C SUE1 Mitochondrial protein required for degradation of unstable forms of cytochrome c [Kazachstania saulgeensis]
MVQLQRYIFKRNLNTIKKYGMTKDSIGSTKQFFKNLPKVPMTKYLERTELSKDMLYCGYRPIIYPVKQNPLFRNKENLIIDFSLQDKQKLNLLNKKNIEDSNDLLFGKNNCGGISTCGVNGIWKYSPTISSNNLPLNIWNSSCMVMQIYKEWDNIPHDITKRLKPFDRG